MQIRNNSGFALAQRENGQNLNHIDWVSDCLWDPCHKRLEYIIRYFSAKYCLILDESWMYLANLQVSQIREDLSKYQAVFGGKCLIIFYYAFSGFNPSTVMPNVWRADRAKISLNQSIGMFNSSAYFRNKIEWVNVKSHDHYALQSFSFIKSIGLFLYQLGLSWIEWPSCFAIDH